MHRELAVVWNRVADAYLNMRDRFRLLLDKYWLSRVIHMPEVLSVDDTLETIERERCSVSRFGDGEIKLLAGESLYFQPFSEELKDRLHEVLTKPVPGHMVCLPDIFGDLSAYSPGAQGHWRGHLAKYRRAWRRNIADDSRVYGNAFISRCYMMYGDRSRTGQWFDGLKLLWRNEDILLVEGEKSRLGMGNDLFEGAASVRRILAPNKDAFACYAALKESVRSLATPGSLVLLALGPTATILAYDLASEGYRALDIGHVDIEYEWYRTGTENVSPVRYKYVNEAGGAPQEDRTDESYDRQVVCRILT